MENMNLLDLDNDVLNIIGDYVKKDNHDRMKNKIKNKMKRGDITFNEYVDIFHVCDYSAYFKYKEFHRMFLN